MIKNLKKPYYLVVFTSQLHKDKLNYTNIADKMLELTQSQDGFLGADSVRDESGFGMTTSYWKDLDSIEKWKNNKEHLAVQKNAFKWYEAFSIHIGRVQ